MKITLLGLNAAMEDSHRRQNLRAWSLLKNFPRVVKDSGQPVVEYTGPLDVNREEIPEDKIIDELQKASEIITNIAENYVDEIGHKLTHLLKATKWDVTIPAGCDAREPAEIQSALKRAVAILRETGHKFDGVTIIHGTGGTDYFINALTDDRPPSIGGVEVNTYGRLEIWDEDTAVKFFPKDNKEGETVVQGQPTEAQQIAQMHPSDRARIVAGESPWYVIPHSKNKPFAFFERVRLKVKEDYTVFGSFGLTCEPNCAVRVSKSKLVLR